MPEPMLDKLFSPLTAAGFLNDYWLRRHLHRNGRPGQFAHLLAPANVEFLAASLTGPQAAWVSLVRGGEDLNLAAVKGANGLISISRLRKARASGFTILLTSLHRRWPAIASFCRSLEAELLERGVALSHPIVANAYATPPAAQGFKAHFDDHEILVLQIAGRKRWRLYAPVQEAPLSVEPLRPEQLGPPVVELDLNPGDILYLPRGCPHDATAAAEATLHLTLAIHCHTWLDLAIALMRREASFRATLPAIPGISSGQAAGWSKGLKQRLDQLANTTRVAESVAAAFREAFIMGIEPAAQLSAEAPPPQAQLGPTTRVGLCPGSFFGFDVGRDGSSILYFPGGKCSGTAEHAPAFRYIVEHPSFTIGELPGIDAAVGLKIAGDLVAQGYLVVLKD